MANKNIRKENTGLQEIRRRTVFENEGKCSYLYNRVKL